MNQTLVFGERGKPSQSRVKQSSLTNSLSFNIHPFILRKKPFSPENNLLVEK